MSGDAFVARILNRAGGIAAIVVDGVAVVANLARADDFVAANDIAGARALRDIRGTVPVGFDFADTIAPVAGQGVPVVALLDTTLIVLSVAAGLRKLSLAAHGAGAVADRAAARRAAGRGRSHGVDDVPTGRSAHARLRSTHTTASCACLALDRRTVASNCRQRKNHRETGPCQMGYKLTKEHQMAGVGCLHRRTSRKKGDSGECPE